VRLTTAVLAVSYIFGKHIVEQEKKRKREREERTAERAFSLSEHTVWREEIKSVMKSQRRYLALFELN